MIFATIKKIIKTVFKAIYSVISFFNLQYALLVLLVGLILFITGVFKENNSIYVIFWVVLGLSILLALSLNYRKLFPKKTQKRGGVGLVKRKKEQEQSQQIDEQPAQQQVVYQQPISYAPVEEKPLKYFRVRQNPNYIVAEFNDRYELYLKTPNGLKKVRADYK